MFEVPAGRRWVLVSVTAKGYVGQAKVVDARGDEALVVVNLVENRRGQVRKLALLLALLAGVYAFARDRCGAARVEACPRLSSTR